MKKLFFQIFLMLVSSKAISCSADNLAPAHTEMMSSFTFSFIALHNLEVGKREKAEHQLQDFIASNVFILSEIVKDKSCNISEGQKKMFWSLATQLAIFDEKYPQKDWKDNISLQNIFDEAKAKNPELSNSLRYEKDWTSGY